MGCLHKPILVILVFVLACAQAHAHAAVWEPSPGHVQVPIWPGAIPDALPDPKPESLGPPPDREWWPRANDVSRPTMTMYAPKSRNSVIGFSAGGHLAAAVSTRFVRREYPTVDAAWGSGIGFANSQPCPYCTPWARRKSACCEVSTPSATILMFNDRAISMMCRMTSLVTA